MKPLHHTYYARSETTYLTVGGRGHNSRVRVCEIRACFRRVKRAERNAWKKELRREMEARA